eukprot:scaffold972_cov126-Skeletonema_dohrnii-CCMP3373.AAC.8
MLLLSFTRNQDIHGLGFRISQKKERPKKSKHCRHARRKRTNPKKEKQASLTKQHRQGGT